MQPTRRFNEAEAFTPRIPHHRIRVRMYTHRRFNEAEAFTPRILVDECKTLWDYDGFNEAEAFTPRIPRIGHLKDQ